MSQAEKVSEPSMDEILASIRKIIAEEPTGTKAPAGGAAASEPKRTSFGLANVPHQPVHAHPVQPHPVEPQPAQSPAAAVPTKSVAPAAALPAASSASVAATPASYRPIEMPRASKEDQNALNHLLLEEDLADLVDPSPLPAATASTSAPAPHGRPAAAVAVGSPMNGLPTPPAGEKPGWRFPRPAPRADAVLDRPPLAPMVPAEAIMPTPRPAAPAPVDRSDETAALARSLAARVGAPPVPGAAPAAPQSDVSLAAAKEAAIKAAARDAASKAAASALDALAAGLAVGAPVKAEATPAVAVAQPEVAAAPVVVAEIATPVLPPEPMSMPVEAANNGVPAHPSVVAEASVEAEIAEGHPASAVKAEPIAVVAPVPTPVVRVAEPAVAAEPAAASAVPMRTMEDTVAELLRPMLREWLDNNMPRIVEKAMRVEMASIVKPTGK